LTEKIQIHTLWVENGVYGWHKKEFTSFKELADYLLSDLSIKFQAGKTVIYSITHSAKKINLDGDYQQLVGILKGQMNLTPSEAKEAASFAIQNLPDQDLAGKLKGALQYLGGKNN